MGRKWGPRYEPNTRVSLEDDVQDWSRAEKVGTLMCLGGVVGFGLGLFGGVSLGENLNDYVEYLSNATETIRNFVTLGSGFAGGAIGTMFGGLIVKKYTYNMFRDS